MVGKHHAYPFLGQCQPASPGGPRFHPVWYSKNVLTQVQSIKNATLASIMTVVASHPTTVIGRESVNLPMMRGFMAMTIMTAIRGAASTPFMTALQYSALMGSRDVKFKATPPIVASAIVA